MLCFDFDIYFFILEYKRNNLLIKDIIKFFFAIQTIFHYKNWYINYFNEKQKFDTYPKYMSKYFI